MKQLLYYAFHPIIYVLIGLTGIGSVGITQILNAYVTQYFPSHARATSLGWGLGLGRIGAIAGLLVSIAVFFIPNKQRKIS